MDFTLCAYGEPEELQFLPKIQEYVDGIELQNFIRKGVASPQGWQTVLKQHCDFAEKIDGRLILHGPFSGIQFDCFDHLLNEAVRRRMNMVYDAANRLRPDTLVLHSGCSDILVRFGLTESWLKQTADFWRREIDRYAEIGITVVIENVVEPAADTLIALADLVGNEHFGLCLDVGHVNLCSEIPPAQWISAMGPRIKHVHLHDNHGTLDDHLPTGSGSIDFDPIFTALKTHVPEVTVSLEVLADPQTVIENIIRITEAYRS
ncbi:MAG: sugar phosphate isomerase/epimerase [Deltaproteobacteria bacterium]|nr:sugar phosphate isomerase/epimerase [Deltaproteobacteria bacterium]